jgi:hypothetical protein
MNSNFSRGPASRPGEPTDAPPGSPRKIRVLTERASRREALFHPHDNLKRRLPQNLDGEEELPRLDLDLIDEADEAEADLVG